MNNSHDVPRKLAQSLRATACLTEEGKQKAQHPTNVRHNQPTFLPAEAGAGWGEWAMLPAGTVTRHTTERIAGAHQHTLYGRGPPPVFCTPAPAAPLPWSNPAPPARACRRLTHARRSAAAGQPWPSEPWEVGGTAPPRHHEAPPGCHAGLIQAATQGSFSFLRVLAGLHWRLDLYPGGYSSSCADHLGVCVELVSRVDGPVAAHYEVALLDQVRAGARASTPAFLAPETPALARPWRRPALRGTSSLALTTPSITTSLPSATAAFCARGVSSLGVPCSAARQRVPPAATSRRCLS